MKVVLTIVPPGGGEADVEYEVDMPTVPRVGDYVTLLVNKGEGFGSFLVLYVAHEFEAEPTAKLGWTTPRFNRVLVQMEPVKDPRLSGRIKDGFEHYLTNPRWAGKVNEFPASGY